jgi:putative ABC transport system permease protein
MNEVGVGGVRTALLTLLGVVGFVLLIACVNVANLMLARAAVRHKELAVRSAMGAGRGRIVRQLLTESVILGLLGGMAGLVIAVWTTSLLPSFLPGDFRSMPLRPLRQIGVDGVVLAFTFGVSCLTGILFGLAPAISAFRGNLNETLKDTARGSTQGSRGRLRHALVASEVALTLVVLAGAGLMIASVSRLLGVDPGLDPKNIVVMEMSLPQIDLYYGPPVHERFCDDLEEQVGSLPGVLSVSTIGHLPLSGGDAGRGLVIEGQPDPGPRNQPGANYSVACPNILKTLGIGLVSGREFTAQDKLGAPQVILINEAMARRFWPKEDALGKRVKIGGLGSDEPWLTVVGIFRDVRSRGLAEEVRQQFLRPYSQAAWPFVSVVAKTAGAPRTMIEPVKKALLRVEPDQAVAGVRTMEEVVSGSVASRRFPMLLLSGFAALALALAAVGIAGVVGYSVVQRTQEIGIRMALGAESKDVLNLVVGGSMAWALGGVGAGVLLSFAALRPLRSLLYGVGSTDPFVLAGVSVVLMAVAAAASYLPARRAARVDPVIALRCE